MTEVVKEPASSTLLLTSPISGEVVTADSYLSDCVMVLSDPYPLPESPRSDDCAAPLAEGLMSLPENEQNGLFAVLDRAYLPLGGDRALDEPMNEGWARRGLVSEAVSQVHRSALAAGNSKLSAQAARLACRLIDEDLLFNEAGLLSRQALTHGLDQRLLGVVRSAASGQVGQSGDSMPPATGQEWIFSEDLDQARDVLVGCLEIPSFYPSQAEASFMLKQYGLDPAVFLKAWSVGYGDPYPSDGWVIKENLQVIANIETHRPGVAKRLFEDRMVRCFARGSELFWWYLDNPASITFQGATPEERRRKTGKCAAIFVATYDHNNALYRPREFDDVLVQIMKAGDHLEYFECANNSERRVCEERLLERNPDIYSVLDIYHSSGFRRVLGEKGAEGADYTVEDMYAEQDWLKKLYATVGNVAMLGCSTLVPEGLASMQASILRARGGIKVHGLGRPAAATFLYDKAEDGFRLKSLETRHSRRMARGGRMSIQASVQRIMTPDTGHYERFSDEIEDELAVSKRMFIQRGI